MLTFEDWANGCGGLVDNNCESIPLECETMKCSEANCPRLDEYTADVEADAYESHLLDKGDDARDREISQGK
jgi:hypothetical protein